MPSLKTFRIEFDKPGATYLAGEEVTGNIIVDIAKEKNISELRFVAKGQAEVLWTEFNSTRDMHGNNHTTHRTYRNSEEYFHLRVNVLCGNRESRVRIPVGLHKYPFRFPLSHNIPSSFEHKIGHVRYIVKAVIDRPWKFDHECKAAFTVISPLDLNAYQHRCLGIDDEMRKSFCICCCINIGSMNVQVRVPSSGYVPGQSIITSLDIANYTRNIQVIDISTKLKQRLKFYATSGKINTQLNELKSTKNSGSAATHTQVVLEMLVPPVPPSNLEYCSIIELNYEMDVSVKVSGPHLRINRTYPIIIGTIPLYASPSAPPLQQLSVPDIPKKVPQNEPATMAVPMPMPTDPTHFSATDQQPTSSTSGSQSHPVGFVHPDQGGNSPIDWRMPPPSYEECISGGVPNIKDHNESEYVHGAGEPFAPRYPVYRFQPLPEKLTTENEK